MRRRRSATFYLYAGSILLHATLAIGAALMPKPKRVETTAISLFEQAKPKEPEKPPPPPPPPPPKEEPPKPKAAPTPAAAEAKAAEAAPATEAPGGGDGFEDIGMAMGGGGSGGIAIPAPSARAAAASTAAAAPVATTKKVHALAPRADDACTEAPVKAKNPKSVVKPIYTDEARRAEIEGVVKVEITVDEEGRVIRARVLNGLGYGLDEAAMTAAKQMTFEPGTRCGKPAVTTTTIRMRFGLE